MKDDTTPRRLRVVGISGSLRAESSNTKLVHEAARLLQPCDLTFADIRFPLLDMDLKDQKGVPDAVELLARQIRAADAVVISTPEYNKNPPGVLKNALDWLSVHDHGCLAGKPMAIMSAAAGRAGGERTQYALRHMLTPFDPRILQLPEVTIAGANKAFGEDGRLADDKSVEFLGKLMSRLRDEVALMAEA